MRFVVSLVVPAALAAQPAQPAQQPADMIVTNARIYTVDEARPLADGKVVYERKVVP